MTNVLVRQELDRYPQPSELICRRQYIIASVARGEQRSSPPVLKNDFLRHTSAHRTHDGALSQKYAHKLPFHGVIFDHVRMLSRHGFSGRRTSVYNRRYAALLLKFREHAVFKFGDRNFCRLETREKNIGAEDLELIFECEMGSVNTYARCKTN